MSSTVAVAVAVAVASAWPASEVGTIYNNLRPEFD